MPRAKINGVDLFWEERGEGDETVVFSHSYLVDHRQFEAQIEALARDFRVVAFDHRSHGGSEAVLTPFGMDDLVADAIGLIEHTGAAPCHFVGLSTGGFVGMRLAHRRPDLVRSLVLMDTSADPESRLAAVKYRAMLRVFRHLGAAPIAGPVMRTMFGPHFRRDPARRKEARRWRTRMLTNDARAIAMFGRAIFSREPFRHRLGSICTPTLVMVGELDVPVPLPLARRIADSIPGAELHVVPRAGHLSTIEAPEAVNAVLVPFIHHHAEGKPPRNPASGSRFGASREAPDARSASPDLTRGPAGGE